MMKSAIITIQQSLLELNTHEELKIISAALNARWSDVNRKQSNAVKANFVINSKVFFNHRTLGRLEGTIIKMNPTKAQVRVASGGIWTVPYTMLKI